MKRYSVQFSCSVVSDSLWSHGLQHATLPCPSPTPRACSNSCPSSWWCHPIISSSVIFFSSCIQSYSASGSFPLSQFFASGGKVLEFQFSITNYQRNANKYNVISPHTSQMSIIKMFTSNKCWRRCGEMGTLQNCWWKCKLKQPPCRTGWRVL